MAASEHAREGVGLDPREVSLPAGHGLLKACWIAGGLGVLALAAVFAVGAGREGGLDQRFWASYWTAWLWGATVALGGLFFVLLHHLTRAGWSVAVRRLAEHVAATLPVLALLALPALFAAGELFPWMGASGAEAGHGAGHDPLLEHKEPFLNAGSFYLRSAVYLVAWSLMAWWFRRRSVAQDASGSPGITRRLQTLSAPGMVVFALTLTFAAFDWVMSLDPHWYSTIFGVYLFAGSTVAILALLILLGIALERRGPLAGVITPEHYHDLGKLLFGFVVFWAYIAFSQFMLIWYANLPEETVWYAHRLEHGWKPVTVALVLGHFVLPFFYLLSRDVKRRRPWIAGAAVWLLTVHYVDLYWLVMPSVSEAFRPHWLDLLTLVAMAGIALGAFGWLARRPALLPVADPRLPESLSFENM